MPGDSFKDTINRIISEKNQKKPFSKVRFNVVYLKKFFARFFTIKVLKLVTFLVLLMLVFVTTLPKTSGTFRDLFDPVTIDTSNYKIYNSGIDRCDISEKFARADDDKSGRYNYTKTTTLVMKPNHKILEFVSHINDEVPWEKPAILIATGVETNDVMKFKLVLSRIQQLTYDSGPLSVSILVSGGDEKDTTIETYLENHFKSNYKDKVRFAKVTVIHLYDQVANPRNFLINNVLAHEEYLLYVSKWRVFRQELESMAAKCELCRGDDFVFMRSSIFKQGIQFTNLLLDGNDWDNVKLLDDKFSQAVDNLCYQAAAVGYRCTTLDPVLAA